MAQLALERSQTPLTEWVWEEAAKQTFKLAHSLTENCAIGHREGHRFQMAIIVVDSDRFSVNLYVLFSKKNLQGEDTNRVYYFVSEAKL